MHIILGPQSLYRQDYLKAGLNLIAPKIGALDETWLVY
jgi:hypothetical protein